MNRKFFWRGISLLAGIFIVLLVFGLMDWQAFAERLNQLSLIEIMAAAGVYLLLNLFRCLRYQALLSATYAAPLRWLFPISLYHNFLVRVLPFKLGELTYIVLIQRYLRIPVEAGLSSLFGSRILELLVIVLVGLGSLFIAGDIFAGQQTLQLIFLVIFIGVGIPSIYFAGSLLRFAASIITRLPVSFAQVIASRVAKLAVEFDTLRQPRRFGQAFFWSFFTYSASFGANWVLLHALNIEMSLALAVLVITLGMFASAFPFNVSGFGMVEISWTFGLTTLLGYSAGEAASIGLLLNGFQIVCAVFYGVIGWLWLRWLSQADANPVDSLAIK
jgi:glycosyltransferase 2 family protein